MATNSPLNSFSSSPNKRLKTIIPNSFPIAKEEFEGNHTQGTLSISTGDSDSSSCGICLSDNGNAIRGEIDSCDHFFCFVCIMEWAKVESRCPMCKRRFATIRRPPKDGVFPAERLVHVLKRDQVYHLNGNTTVGPSDPYAQVQCSVCSSSADESLLLLCDLCDSAAHTYCVGLGITVPEGDWFCQDCAFSKTAHENIQREEEDVNQNLFAKSNEMIPAEPNIYTDVAINNQSTSQNSNAVAVDKADISIFDIVCESDDPFLARLRTRSISFPLEGQSNLSDEMNLPAERTKSRSGKRKLESDSDKINQNDARTLRRCRNVHGYVRALRENWNALRSGSLRFSYHYTSSQSSGTRRGNCTIAISHESPGKSQSLPSTSGQQVTTNDSLHGISAKDSRSHDVDKAWKMLDKAKSIKQACTRTKDVNCVSENPSRRGTPPRKATDGSSRVHLSRSQLLATTGLETSSVTDKEYSLLSPGKETDKHVSTKFGMQKCRMTIRKATVGSNDNQLNSSPRFSASVSSWKAQTSSQSNASNENQETSIDKNLGGALCALVSSWKVQTSSQSNASNENQGTPVEKNVGGAVRNVTDMQDAASDMITLVSSVPEASELSNKKAVLETSSSCKVYMPEGDVKTERGCKESKAGKTDNAKSEIQSLVKLNLKILNGDKQLGVNGFKEVARLATHTILAACGFEHSKHVFHSFPRSVCSHSDRLQELRKSTLMKNSCRECFFIFVKDVVNSVLSEKLSQAGAVL